MLSNIENRDDGCKDNTSDTGILEQSFSELPPEGKIYLKDCLQNLVSMQNTMVRAISVDNAHSSSKDGEGVC
jgi:hypothetical protein